MVSPSVDSAQKARYLEALEKYARFVTAGCKTVPTLNSTATPLGESCPPKGRGWVNLDGKDAGSLGDGYYKGSINLTPVGKLENLVFCSLRSSFVRHPSLLSSMFWASTRLPQPQQLPARFPN
eukprot:SAG31_NODE_4765_length_2970_cov_21.015640_4_plen_123_part_00